MAKPKRSAKARTLTEFRPFKKFPPEIREMVWKLALAGANTVEIWSTKFYVGPISGGNLGFDTVLSAYYKVPVLLHTSQESREVTKKIYTKLFESEIEFAHHPIYFNLAVDVLYISDNSTFEHLCCLGGFKFAFGPDAAQPSFSSPIMSGLRRLQIGQQFEWYLKPFVKEILGALGKPELVVLHKPKDCRSLQDWTFRELQQEIEGEWGTGDEEGDKYKPELLVLTELQLAKMLNNIDNPLRPKRAKAPKAILPATRRSDRFVERPMSYYEGGKEVDNEIYAGDEEVEGDGATNNEGVDSK